MIVSEAMHISLKFPDSAFFTASRTWTILFGSRSLLRYATFHFLSCFPSALSCGVYNWNSLHVCWCDGAIVTLRPCVSFFYPQPSRWIKLSKSFQNVRFRNLFTFSLSVWLTSRGKQSIEPATQWLLLNSCHWYTLALSHKVPYRGKPVCAVGINGFSAGRHWGAAWVTLVITLLTITNPLESRVTFLWGWNNATIAFDEMKD